MAADENIGGVNISVGADFSDLDAQFDAAIAKAQQRSSAMADAIQDGVKAPDVSPVTNALDSIGASAQSAGQTIQEALKLEAPTLDTSQITGALSALSDAAIEKAAAIADAINSINTDGATSALIRLGESAGITGEDLDRLTKRMDELVQSGAAATQGEALTTALRELGTAAQADVEKLDALAAAEKAAGDAANEGGDGQKKFSEGVQSIIDKQATLDEALRQAIATLGEMHDAYAQGQVSADALAQAENRVDEALRAASPNLENVKNNVKEVAVETETAADRFAKFAEAMAAVASAFAFTEALKGLGMAALEAADKVDDATKAISMLGGGSEKAEASISQLRQIASEDALSFPNLLIASQRMTAFTEDATKVPGIMRAAADSAQVMGVGVESAAKAIERFAAGGDLSAKSLKALGLTMGDMAAVLGTTEEKAKAAFAALNQAEKLDAVVSALGKFKGAAKDASDDALGSLVRMGQQWDQVLEEIGKALEPVLKSLVQFAQANILAPVKAMAEAFNTLPTPVKEFAGGLALAAAAIVPLAGAVAAVSAAIGPLSAVLAPVAAAFISIATESIPAAVAALGTFATVSLPAAISAAAAFATTLITDAVASVTTFATVAIPEAIAALGVLVFTTIPAAIAGFGTLATEGITAAATSFTAFAADAVAAMVASLTSLATGAIPLAVGALSALGGAAVLAAGAFAGFELGKWLYNNVGFLHSFGDAIAGVIGKLEDWVTESTVVAKILASMGDQQAKNVLSTIELANTTQKLADNLAKHGVVLKQGSDSLEVWNEKLVAAAASLGKTGDAAGNLTQKMTLAKAQIDGHAASLETLRGNLDAANEKLINAAAAYEKAKTSGQGLQQATENLAKAQAEATKASDALNKPVKDMSESFAKAESAVTSFNAKVAAGGTVDQLQKAFENASKAIDTLAKKNLPDAIASVDAYLAAQERMGAKSTVIMEAFQKESDLIQKLAKESLPQASDAMLRLIDTLGKGTTPLGVWQKALADEEAILGKLANESLSQAEAGWQKLIAELERGNAPASVLTKALQDHTEWLTKVAKASDAAEAAFIKLANAYAGINLHGPEANKIFSDTYAALDKLGILLPKLPQPISDTNKAMIDLGTTAGKVKTAVEDLKTPIEQLVTDLGNLITKAQASGDWSPILTALDNFDKRIQILSKTDLPEAVKEMESWIHELENHKAPSEIVQGQLDKLGSLVERMAKEQMPGWVEAWKDYLTQLEKFPPASAKIVENLQLQVDKQAAVLQGLINVKAAYGDILAAQGELLQSEISLAEKTGTDANSLVLSLERVKLKQEELKLSAHGLADEYVQMINDVLKGFDQMAGAMAGAIVDGKNLGDALVGVFKGIAKSILTDVIQAAMLPLKTALIELISGLLPGMTAGLNIVGGGMVGLNVSAGAAATGLKALAAAAQEAAAEISASSATASGGGTGGGGMASTVGAIGAVVAAGAAVASAILLGHISSDTGHIEVNTREAEAELQNVRKDAWDQHNQMYDRVGELKNSLDSIRDILIQTAQAGGGIGPVALADLDSIAADIHTMRVQWPGIQGGLSTIASDIVTWGGYIMTDLDVIVQKLGILVTTGMGGSSDMAHASDVAAAASAVAAAIGDAADQTGSDLKGQSASITGAIIDTGARQATITDTRLQQAIDVAQNQYNAATSANAQLDALRNEYQATQVAMDQAERNYEQALKDGNTELANQYKASVEDYRQALLNLQGQITPMLSAEVNYTRDAAANTDEIASELPRIGFAATDAGTVVSTAVKNAATTISTAVTTSAASTQASFAAIATAIMASGVFSKPGSGTTSGTTVYSGGPGGSVGTPTTGPGSPGYGQPTGGPTTATGGFGGVVKPPETPTTTANPTAAQPYAPWTGSTGTYAPAPGAGAPMMATGGTVVEGGAAKVDTGEVVLKPDMSNVASIVLPPGAVASGPDYAAILKQAMANDAILQQLIDQVNSQQTWIVQYTANHAPPAMMKILQDQLDSYNGALKKYEEQMGYIAKIPAAITGATLPPLKGGPQHPAPGSSEFPQLPTKNPDAAITGTQVSSSGPITVGADTSDKQTPLLQAALDVANRQLQDAKDGRDQEKAKWDLIIDNITKQLGPGSMMVRQYQQMEAGALAQKDDAVKIAQAAVDNINKQFADLVKSQRDAGLRPGGTPSILPTSTSAPPSTTTPHPTAPTSLTGRGTLVVTDPARPLNVVGMEAAYQAQPTTDTGAPTTTDGPSTDPVTAAMEKLNVEQARMADLMQQLATASTDQKPLIQSQIDLLRTEMDHDQMALAMAQQQADLQKQLVAAQNKMQDDQDSKDKAQQALAEATSADQKTAAQAQLDALNKILMQDQANIESLNQHLAVVAVAAGAAAASGAAPPTSAEQAQALVSQEQLKTAQDTLTNAINTRDAQQANWKTIIDSIEKQLGPGSMMAQQYKQLADGALIKNNEAIRLAQSQLDAIKALGASGSIPKPPDLPTLKGGPVHPGTNEGGQINGYVVDLSMPGQPGFPGNQQKSPADIIGGVNYFKNLPGSQPVVDLSMPGQPGFPGIQPTPATPTAAPTTPVAATNGGAAPTAAGVVQDFNAGVLADLNDIRDVVRNDRDWLIQIHTMLRSINDAAFSSGQLTNKKLDTLHMDMSAMIVGVGGTLPSFDLGGAVPADMVAQLHAGEEVLAPDLSVALRRMVSVPSGGFAHPNPAGDMARTSTRITTINATVNISGMKGGRAAAEEFVEHLKRIVPDANGYSS